MDPFDALRCFRRTGVSEPRGFKKTVEYLRSEPKKTADSWLSRLLDALFRIGSPRSMSRSERKRRERWLAAVGQAVRALRKEAGIPKRSSAFGLGLIEPM